MEDPSARKIPPPFGVARDVRAFYSSLVPQQKSATAPRALVPTVDVVLTAKGRPTRWLCTGDGGEATEKLSTDKGAMLRVFQAAGACRCARARGRAHSYADAVLQPDCTRIARRPPSAHNRTLEPLPAQPRTRRTRRS